MSSLRKDFCLVPFPFTSRLTLGLAEASLLVSLPFFDGVLRALLSELSEISLEEVVEHQAT